MLVSVKSLVAILTRPGFIESGFCCGFTFDSMAISMSINRTSGETALCIVIVIHKFPSLGRFYWEKNELETISLQPFDVVNSSWSVIFTLEL
jgi:hypothetical protein